MKWFSWDNKKSFWMQKEHLLQLIRDIGFDLVFEEFDCLPNIISEMTEGYYAKNDRVMLVGIKSNVVTEKPTVSAELKCLRDELAGLRSSISWRVTAPLRALRRMLG